jgi:hypothetical protein
MPGLPVYHLYNSPESGAPARPLHWDEQHDRERERNWWDLEQRSRARLAALVDNAPMGVYGIGRIRSLEDYAEFSGIDFKRRKLSPRAFRPAES